MKPGVCPLSITTCSAEPSIDHSMSETSCSIASSYCSRKRLMRGGLINSVTLYCDLPLL